MTFEERTYEYMEMVRKLKKNIDDDLAYVFRDGRSMRNWYYNSLTNIMRYKEDYNDYYDQIYLLAQIDNLLYDIKEEKKQKFDRKTDEYIEKLKEIKRKLKCTDRFRFEDHSLMYSWYQNHIKYVKTNSLQKNYNLALIDNTLFDLGYKDVAISRMTFEEKAEECIKTLKEEGSLSKNSYFSDGSNMFYWFNGNRSRGTILKENKIYFQKVLDVANNIEHKLSFEEKRIEYQTKVKEMGRIIKSRDEIYFSDGHNMGMWFDQYNQKMNYKISHNLPLTENDLYVIKSLDEILEMVGKKRTIRLSFDERVQEYKEKIKEINRKIMTSDDFQFRDQRSMAQWYFKTRSRFYEKRKKDLPYTEEELDRMMLFASIDNLYYDLGLKSKVKVKKD